MRPLALAVLTGVVACGVTIGLVIVTGAGADLTRAVAVIAVVFATTGAAAGRTAASTAAAALAGSATVLSLAAAGIAFNTLAWSASFVITAALATAGGAIAARGWRRRARPRAVAAIAITTAVIAGYAGLVVPRLIQLGALERGSRPLPAIALATGDGTPIAQAEWTGKVVVLALWATWCKPCLAELPELERVVARYRGDPRVIVLAVNPGTGGDTPGPAAAFARTSGWRVPLAFGDGDGVMTAVGVTGLPAIVVVDRRGRQRLTHRGFDRSEDLVALLAPEIDRLLVEP